MITGYTKFDFDEYSRQNIKSTINAYKDYKKCFKFPKGIKGYVSCVNTHNTAPHCIKY